MPISPSRRVKQPATRQYARVVPHKRSDTGKMSYVVKWIARPGDARRRTFEDPAEAEREADYVEGMFQKGMRIVTDLSLTELSGVALLLSQIPNVPAHEVIQFYLREHRLNGHEAGVAIEKAGNAFIASRNDPAEFSKSQIQAVRQHLHRFQAHFPTRLLNTFQLKELDAYIESEVGGAPKTRANHVTTLRSFGRWARIEQKWLPRGTPSAFEEMKKPWVPPSDKEIYSPEEITRYLVFTPLAVLPFIAIGAFGGVRAAERLRLEGKHWQPENAQLEMSRDITKTGRRRLVGSLPNLVEWMDVIAPEEGEHVVSYRGYIYGRTSEIAKAAGLKWKFNALRTSFASYHLQLFKNAPLTAALDGHTVEQLERDYKTLRGVSDKTASEWFAITPWTVVKYALDNDLPAPEWAWMILLLQK
jgi:integrase